MIMADGDVLDLIRRELELAEEIDEAGLWCRRSVSDGVARVPDQVFVAMPDEIAAEGQLHLEAAERVGVGHAAADVGRCVVRTAVESRERDEGRRLRCRR